MSVFRAIIGCEIFDGKLAYENSALIISGPRIVGIVEHSNLPTDCQVTELDGGLIAPGFIDLQVNGGGGVLLNERPDVDAIKLMCASHAEFGTTAMLPTLISDSPQITRRAIEAGIEAYQQSVPGFIGLHLEGPHLSKPKHGAHKPSFIREMEAADVQLLMMAAGKLPYLLVTLAPESVTNEQIKELSNAGVIVSLGHSNASYLEAETAIDAGARCVTHLFNAMSPLNHREPGIVGAALNIGSVYTGLIADGIHVDPVAISVALAAKKGPGQIFLVTDAMSTIGTKIKSFKLNDRTIYRQNGCLKLADGTLAGADLDMITAVRYMQDIIGVSRFEAIRMASSYPANCIQASNEFGNLRSGAFANIVHLSDENHVEQTWWKGVPHHMD
ncbi:MAG: N-acetylglucosamine-6-phosphate deacetylase [Hyphomicrobiales bacterium]|nr:N-acetylglucosamine-6-phosphate deacetylase [Hyphomicrobiales bacterium]